MSPTKQFYHCFGCGAHGTVVSFLMNYDRLSFVEAVEDLAQRLGIEVPREGGDRPDAPAVSDDLYTLMEKVATFYQEQLDASERAREYAKKRGLTRDIAAQFGIGYAPDSWNEVLKRFGASEASRAKLLELGLIRERDKDKGEGHYDYFRDRLMFPIRDQRGRVIAFGGRVLDAGEPKYLNSPETALFHKGRELYGLYEVRQDRAPLTRLMVVEGYMDVVRLHQAGVGVCRGHARHLHHARAPEARVPAGARDHLLLRRRQGRPRRRVARAGQRAARDRSRPRAEIPVPARRRGSGLAGGQGRQGRVRGALRRRAAAVGIPGGPPDGGHRPLACRRQGALRGRSAAAAGTRAGRARTANCCWTGWRRRSA